jgi:hypothetical protein
MVKLMYMRNGDSGWSVVVYSTRIAALYKRDQLRNEGFLAEVI